MNFKNFIQIMDQWVVELADKGFLYDDLQINISHRDDKHVLFIRYDNEIIRYLEVNAGGMKV